VTEIVRGSCQSREAYAGILSSHKGTLIQVFALPSCYAAYFGSLLPTFRYNLSSSVRQSLSLTLEDGNDILSRNVSNHVPTYTA
jgi:hypothetical protein